MLFPKANFLLGDWIKPDLKLYYRRKYQLAEYLDWSMIFCRFKMKNFSCYAALSKVKF